MKLKWIAAVILAVLLAGTGAAFSFSGGLEPPALDPVAVNDIAQSLIREWDTLENAELPGRGYGLDYAVLDTAGNLRGATRPGLNVDLHSAVVNRDTVVDLARDGAAVGKLILYNDTPALWRRHKRRLLAVFLAATGAAALLCLAYAVYLDKTVFRPFRRLQAFARHVAAGDLDHPLEMDRGNRFGAFTESFDLMREELAKARENERAAERSKKELVASLSHDIKTPVASIKAVSEVLMLKSADGGVINRLEVITAKADQIDALITNMFNAALEELQELKVAAAEQSSAAIAPLIEQADYDGRADVPAIPGCVVLADAQRLAQVFDNIIGNSYKYAGTSIRVSAGIKGPYLEISFEDYGPGVGTDEAPLLFHKYYRAKNAAGKSGAGLGLYISKHLMERMSGEISCANTGDGFAVTVRLRIA